MTVESKIKHLELIQAVITRLSEHSFRLKTFGLIQVVGAMVALVSGKVNALVFFVPVGASLVIWGLDAWFLREERAYRALFDHVRKLDEGDVDFSMDAGGRREKLVSVALSSTLSVFYPMLVGVSLIVALSR